MATNVERKKLSRANEIVHLVKGDGRSYCKRALLGLKVADSGVFNCEMCEKQYNKEKEK